MQSLAYHAAAADCELTSKAKGFPVKIDAACDLHSVCPVALLAHHTACKLSVGCMASQGSPDEAGSKASLWPL